MNLPERIPTEMIQLFSSSEAWNYRLVPYAQGGDSILCAGDRERNYASVTQEIEVLFGFQIQIEFIETEELIRLLNFYYRKEEVGAVTSKTADLSRIGSGQGFLMELIGEAFNAYASDIHFESYEERCRIRLRIDGKLIEKYVLDRNNYVSLVNQVKIIANLDISERRLPQDGRILYHQGEHKFDLRVSSLPTIFGEKIVLRLLTRHTELLNLSNLGFSERQLTDYTAAISRPHGMALITGPTGSGKSTTLYATLRKLNRESGNILTIEDPVEYTLEGVNQVQLKEEIGLTFGAALRTFLRQDPDVIMLGEIRDADTAAMAIRSSLTGHLVFSTIHTNSAWGSISRLRDMGVHPYLLSGTLILCVAQRLMRLLCSDCKKQSELTEAEWTQIYDPKRAFAEKPGSGSNEPSWAPFAVKTFIHYRAGGCEKCYYTGYRSRKAIYEVIPIDDVLSEAVRENCPDVGPLLKERGITTLRDSALELFRSGETSLEELLPLLRE